MNSLPTAFASFTATPGNYTMALTEVATAGATPGNTDNFVLNMQVYNP